MLRPSLVLAAATALLSGAVDAKINAEEALAVLPLAIKGDTEAVHTMESGTFDSVCV